MGQDGSDGLPGDPGVTPKPGERGFCQNYPLKA